MHEAHITLHISKGGLQVHVDGDEEALMQLDRELGALNHKYNIGNFPILGALWLVLPTDTADDEDSYRTYWNTKG